MFDEIILHMIEQEKHRVIYRLKYRVSSMGWFY